MKRRCEEEKLCHYIFLGIFSWINFLKWYSFCIYICRYQYTWIYVIYVCICTYMQTFTCVYIHIRIYNFFFQVCVCFILKISAVLWTDLMVTSASYVLWDLFGKAFRFFAQCHRVFRLIFAGEHGGFCHTWETFFRLALWETVTREALNYVWPHREEFGGNQVCPDSCLSGAVAGAVPCCSVAARRRLGTAPAVNCMLDCCWKPFRLWPVPEWSIRALRPVRSKNNIFLSETPYDGVRHLVT